MEMLLVKCQGSIVLDKYFEPSAVDATGGFFI